ncbi:MULTISPECIES: DUF6193 family natural product biosynthesis protein [unclassified Micromonospora]|uniref:DUF6193 family natural product biosynthesis protein n=1 Tax=unclassified Micromonospora TaxID=2617518 RepID=UPI001B37CF89|nr:MULTISPECIES: DUF6193 family natural product biosynthesis protein [unclassified Micromonospora]MBQ1041039.1 hypothetical protein [Micromonospora sp. C72]MBQ1055160.1 hypothetical protein [Micromonospora sp. C32]
MPTYPDPAVLYPEVAAEGSLAAALRAVAARDGLAVPVPVTASSSFQVAVVPSTVAHRKALEVSVSHVERRWFLRGCERDQGLALIRGDTVDLAQVARAAQAWHDATPLTEIPRVAPFVTLTGRFEVPDRDPVRLVESEWRHLRMKAAQANWPEHHALVETAYAEPRLRRLYPFTSHWSLRFSTSTRPGLSHDVLVCLHAGRGGDYVVTMGLAGWQLGRTATAEGAVALAVSSLPPNLGPVRYGAAEPS